MTTITLEIPNKYKDIIDKKEIKKISSYFVDDYLKEKHQDKILKEKLSNNNEYQELNKSLEKAL